MVIVVFGLFASDGIAIAAEWRLKVTEVERKFGVVLEFDAVSIPKDVSGDRGIEIKQTAEGSRAGYLAALRPALDAYSKDFLKRNLSKIAIYETMTVDGVAYGGTYDAIRKVVYLQGRQIGKKTAGFHHEFSSILLANYGLLFPAGEWRAANPAGFEYPAASAGAEALARDSDIEGGPGVYEKGFIAGYGMTRLEEDVNTYFQVLMPCGLACCRRPIRPSTARPRS
jgi:hypothetical protein